MNCKTHNVKVYTVRGRYMCPVCCEENRYTNPTSWNELQDFLSRIGKPVDLDQPDPIKNDEPSCWDLVLADMRERDQVGRARYGTPLQPHNGRDALKDAYAEALDLVVYMRQALYERDGA